MSSPVADLLSHLGAGLREIGAPWYLFGARAAILYGVARLTADVDVTVRLPDATTDQMLVGALERHGFRLRISDPDFVARTQGDALDEGAIRRTLIALEEALVRNDLLSAFEAALARARRAR